MKTLDDLVDEAWDNFSGRFNELKKGNPHYFNHSIESLIEIAVDDLVTTNSDLDLLQAVFEVTPFYDLVKKLKAEIAEILGERVRGNEPT